MRTIRSRDKELFSINKKHRTLRGDWERETIGAEEDLIGTLDIKKMTEPKGLRFLTRNLNE